MASTHLTRRLLVKVKYLWNERIAILRKVRIAYRRHLTRARRRLRGNMPHADVDLIDRYHGQYKQAIGNLKKEILISKNGCWKNLVEEVNAEPWGLA